MEQPHENQDASQARPSLKLVSAPAGAPADGQGGLPLRWVYPPQEESEAPTTIPLPGVEPDYILTVERPGQFLIFMAERTDGRPGIRVERA